MKGHHQPFPAAKPLESRLQGEGTKRRWTWSRFEPICSPTARGHGQMQTSLTLAIAPLYSYTMPCRSTATIWGLSTFWVSQGSSQYTANILHFACLVSWRVWAPLEAATIYNPSTDPCLAGWAHQVLFHGKCHISAFLREKDDSTTINSNSKSRQQKKDRDTAVCLLKTLHYKITKFWNKRYLILLPPHWAPHRGGLRHESNFLTIPYILQN